MSNGNYTMFNIKKQSPGVTFIEILVVIILISLMAVIASPSIKSFNESIKLRTASNTIKQRLFLARARALGDASMHCGMYFDTLYNPDRIIVFYDNDSTSVNDNSYSVNKDQLYMPEYKMPRNIKISLSGTGNNKVIVFRGDGSAKTPVPVVTVINTISGKTKSISVLASTGRIRVQ
jgi:prepilin-type N-terminal cleavage/methylation domain-containing protein